ncbi:hypothetical protein [Vibrio breoganii]|uniref:hypothetical protein n=1 Tax=Vibrio breoganii TaxID=553239 RepID=UPI0021C48BD9|nr:hypothetical protein [Vibrio breoganii]MDN3717764.1 hypothetical protein [Vibrio breoganii]
MNNQEKLAQIKADKNLGNQEDKAKRELLYIESPWYQKTNFALLGAIVITCISKLIFSVFYANGYSFKLNAFSFSFSSALITFSLMWWVCYSKCKTPIGRITKFVGVGIWIIIIGLSYFMIYGNIIKFAVLHNMMEFIPDNLGTGMVLGVILGSFCSIFVGGSMREHLFKRTSE